MPTRLLREGILTSERIDQLDAPAEVFYRRLMSKVDDHGLYDARPSILRSSLFPLRVDRVREADISRWIAACEKAGLIALYQHDGKPFMRMLDTRWTARSEPKYPLPTAENSCKQPQTPVPVFGVVDEDVDEGDTPARKRASRPSVEKPEGVTDGTWADWLALRKAKRAPVTQTVLDSASAEAQKAGLPLQRFLEIWCMRGSQGLQADWLRTDERRSQDIRTVTVPSSPERDPALVKLDVDARRAVPIPAAIREQLKTLAKGAH